MGSGIRALFGEVDLVVLFVDSVVELVVDFVHTAALVAHVFVFRLLDELFVRRIRHELHQLRVFGSRGMPGAGERPLLFLPVSNELFGVCDDFRDEIPLGGNDPLNGDFISLNLWSSLLVDADDQWSRPRR